LLNLNNKSWIDGLKLQDYNDHCKLNEQTVKQMLDLANNYNKALEFEEKIIKEQLVIKKVGKQDPKRPLEDNFDVLMTSNIFKCMSAILSIVVFK
jgi:26S proteasome regulatory subunit N11